MAAFRYGWGKEGGTGGPFWLEFDAAMREPGTWKEELYAAARTVASSTDKPIWICSSGGIDSEVACRAFFEQDIPFSVLTLVHEQGTNAHDVQFAHAWCEENRVRQKVVTVDIERFLTDEIDAYAERFIAIHPFRFLQLRLLEAVEEMGGFAILGSGEQIYIADTTKEHITPADVHLPFSNGMVMPLEWSREMGTAHEPYFHFATPELCLSYMQLPVVDFALRNPDPLFRHQANTYTLKRLAYHSVWPEMPLRYKAHGFDTIRPLYDAATARLRERFMSHYVPVDMPLPEFQRQLTGELPRSRA